MIILINNIAIELLETPLIDMFVINVIDFKIQLILSVNEQILNIINKAKSLRTNLSLNEKKSLAYSIHNELILFTDPTTKKYSSLIKELENKDLKLCLKEF